MITEQRYYPLSKQAGCVVYLRTSWPGICSKTNQKNTYFSGNKAMAAKGVISHPAALVCAVMVHLSLGGFPESHHVAGNTLQPCVMLDL